MQAYNDQEVILEPLKKLGCINSRGFEVRNEIAGKRDSSFVILRNKFATNLK